MRYPEDYFNAQAQMFATYHVTDPGVLYNKGNQWEIPVNASAPGTVSMSPYYMIMRLPGQTTRGIRPHPPLRAQRAQQHDRLARGSVGRAQLRQSGELRVSFQLNVYGPAQVEAAINQDPTISSQRTLWGQQGSTVIFGNLLTVPIGNSLLYVQPLYLQSSQTQLPQIQRIIVFYRSPSATPNLPSGQQQNVVMAQTLGQALTSIFGGTAPTGTAARRDDHSYHDTEHHIDKLDRRATDRSGQLRIRGRAGGLAGGDRPPSRST